MIKTNKKLDKMLKLVKPINEINKLKISDCRHPCHIWEDHDLIKKRILSLNIIK